ncbi:MAG: NADH-quinone oxidoreductase subunit NuoE [Deltaproteobacteria bacterium]|nr:NADH-quinone oxidoreductase subunit NuoE [Deltaproteobacteria bacterium]
MAKKKEHSKAGGAREALLSMIKEEQLNSGYVADKAMAEIARTLGLPVSDVYGVATFYSFLSTTPTGKHVIRVCESVPCCLRDAEMIIAQIRGELGIAPGETTSDGRFSLELTNCIGACDQAPAMLVDDEVHGGLTPENIVEILRSYD